jgi:hypothetical protein
MLFPASPSPGTQDIHDRNTAPKNLILANDNTSGFCPSALAALINSNLGSVP